MKKILILFLFVSSLFCVSSVIASVTTDLSASGSGSSVISTDHASSGVNSAEIYAPLIVSYPPSNEGRVVITPDMTMLLANLTSFSWTEFISQGYAAHVDVNIDTNGDDIADDSLVFEYAKVDPLDCDDSADYPTGSINTFGDKGIVDNNAYAWLNSGPAGPCGDATFDANHKSLSDWKSTYPGAKIVSFEIEVDGWIEESEAYIDDVMLNGVVVEDFEVNNNAEQEVNAEVSEIVDISVNDISYGSVVPGMSYDEDSIVTVGSANNVDLSVGIEVTDSGTGNLFWHIMFDQDNNGFGDDSEIGSGMETVDILDNSGDNTIPTRLNVPLGFTPGSNTGTVTYTAMKKV